jgi:tetratricopeptide (TPR) repeat protein
MATTIIRLSERREKTLVKKVDALIQYGAYERAIRCCEEFIEASPKSLNAHFVKHEVHIAMGRYEDSLQDAHDLLRNKEYEREGLFLKLLSLTALLARPRPHLTRARSGHRQENCTQQFEEIAQKALTNYKGDTQIAYMIAEGYQLLGMKHEAAELLEEHLKTRPWDVHCLYQLGLIYQGSGKYEKALDCYDRGLKSIQEYSESFKENFSRLISDSRHEVLDELGINQIKGR